VLISVAVSTSTTDAGALILLLERREVRELERRLGVLDRRLLLTEEDLLEELRFGVRERLCFDDDLLFLRLALLEALGVFERRVLRFAEDLLRLLRRLPRLGALELLGVRARRLLLFERRRDREVEALVAERDRLRFGAFGVLALRAERRGLELERRDVEARDDERRLVPFGDFARRPSFLASLVVRRRLRFGVRALRAEWRRAFLTFRTSPLRLRARFFCEILISLVRLATISNLYWSLSVT